MSLAQLDPRPCRAGRGGQPFRRCTGGNGNSGAIRAIVYPVSGLANVTRSSTAPPPCAATVAGMTTIFYPNGPRA